MLQSGSLLPTIGAKFTNNSGIAITQFPIKYTGEQWRCGETTGRLDSIQFQYSTNATSLSTGTWVNVNDLKFLSRDVSSLNQKDGNLSANRLTRSALITGVNIANGGSFWIRWADFDVLGAEDGLGVDDFIFNEGGTSLPIELTTFNFTVNQNTVNLFWQTAKEENNEGFDIERKNEVDNWIKIANIKGAGNSTVPQSYNFEDKNIKAGNYFYRLKQIDYNGNFEYFNLNQMVIIESPKKFSLDQNYPNPFNPLTTISFSLPHDAVVRLSIFDMLGKEITTLVDKKLSAGMHQYIFDGKNISSGIYFYKIETNNFIDIKKMMVIK